MTSATGFLCKSNIKRNDFAFLLSSSFQPKQQASLKRARSHHHQAFLRRSDCTPAAKSEKEVENCHDNSEI